MKSIAIVTPVLNDWESLSKLVTTLIAQEDIRNSSIRVLCVDDGSTSVQFPDEFTFSHPIESLDVLCLQANQGHQRAIALGLAYVHKNYSFDIVIVMDSDGEDRPEDVSALLNAHSETPDSIIVAERRRRSEGFGFKLFYQFYKLIFALLTGRPISFGNFSLIPRARLPNVIFNAGIWNNFAATILKSRIPIVFVGTNRGERYFGSSKMNFTSLMIHGMSAISIFTDVVIGRIIAFLCMISVGVAALVVAVIYLKFATTVFVPGYATYVILFALTTLAIALFSGVLTVLSLLANREQAATYPTDLLETLTRETISIAGKSPK